MNDKIKAVYRLVAKGYNLTITSSHDGSIIISIGHESLKPE